MCRYLNVEKQLDIAQTLKWSYVFVYKANRTLKIGHDIEMIILVIHAYPSLSEYVLCWVIDLFRISLFTLLGLLRQQTKPLVSNVIFFTTSQRNFLFIYHKTRPVYPIWSAHQASLGSAGHPSLLTKMGNAREVSCLSPALSPAHPASHDGHPRPW